MEKEITFTSKNEQMFVEWYKNTFEDYWESEVRGNPIHHYIFKKNDKKFHISFTFLSIVCSLIIGDNEKDIYLGYMWSDCLKKLKKIYE